MTRLDPDPKSCITQGTMEKPGMIVFHPLWLLSVCREEDQEVGTILDHINPWIVVLEWAPSWQRCEVETASAHLPDRGGSYGLWHWNTISHCEMTIGDGCVWVLLCGAIRQTFVLYDWCTCTYSIIG
jgi:hypothetical protein